MMSLLFFVSASFNYNNSMVTFSSILPAQVPAGVEVIFGGLAYATKRPLSDLHLLDAGLK